MHFTEIERADYLVPMNTAKMTDELVNAGMRQQAIADYCGVSQSTVSRWRKGIDPEGVSRDKLIELYRSKFGPKPAHASASDLIQIPDLAIFGGMGPGGELDVYTDANSGALIDPEQIRGYWSLPDYMVRGLGALKHIYAWEVRGDSMEPTLPGGSVVFVDTSQNTPPPEDIYAINYGDGLMVKRLKLIPRSDRVAVISDNERYGTDDLLREDVHIWGRVVGHFQWRG